MTATNEPADDVGERLARLEAVQQAAALAVDAAFKSLDVRLNASAKADEDARQREREVADRERAAMQQRLEGMNEFRQQLNDQSKTFATVEALQTKFDQLSERLTQNRDDILTRLAALERLVTTRNETTATQFAAGQGSSDLIRWAIPILIGLALAALAYATR